MGVLGQGLGGWCCVKSVFVVSLDYLYYGMSICICILC